MQRQGLTTLVWVVVAALGSAVTSRAQEGHPVPDMPVMLGARVRAAASGGPIALPAGVTGAMVWRLLSGSAAESGGLQVGDLIVALWRQGMAVPARVTRSADLEEALRDAQDGDELQLVICRRLPGPGPAAPEEQRFGARGAAAGAEEVGFVAAGPSQVVRVEAVDEGSLCAAAGICQGDLLLSIAAKPGGDLQPIAVLGEPDGLRASPGGSVVFGRRFRLSPPRPALLREVADVMAMLVALDRPAQARRLALQAKAAYAAEGSVWRLDPPIARTYVIEGDAEKAMAHLTGALGECDEPAGRAALLHGLARVYAGLERWREAYETMERAARESGRSTRPAARPEGAEDGRAPSRGDTGEAAGAGAGSEAVPLSRRANPTGTGGTGCGCGPPAAQAQPACGCGTAQAPPGNAPPPPGGCCAPPQPKQ